jgi:hypothetical protein
MSDGTERAPPIEEFFENGCQYYIAGRYAAFAGLNPVAGNVLHHAIEQFLKGALSTKSLKDLKGMNHRLPDIWKAFKDQANDSTLARFDDVISELHKFEDIRYPSDDSVGMLCTFDITKAGREAVKAIRNALSLPATPASSVPPYSLCLEEIDELVGAVFVAASRSPKAYFPPSLKLEAKEYLAKENAASALAEAWSSPPVTR